MVWLTWVAARPDAELIAIADSAGRLRVFSPAQNRVVARQDIGARIERAEWTRDGQLLVAIAADRLHVFTSDGGRSVTTIETRHESVAGLCVHPSRTWAATAGTDGCVRVWDLTTAKAVLEVKEPSQGTVVAMSEHHLAAGWRSGHFVAWDLASGKDLAGGELFGAYVSAIAFSPDGKSLVCGGGQGGIVELLTMGWQMGDTWRSTPPKPIATNAIEFAPDRRFVCAHSDDTASLFASTSDRAPRRLGYAFYVDCKPWKQDYIVSGACFLPSTKLVVTSHFSGQLRVFEEDGLLHMKVAEIAFDDQDVPAFVDRQVDDGVRWWAEKTGRLR